MYVSIVQARLDREMSEFRFCVECRGNVLRAFNVLVGVLEIDDLDEVRLSLQSLLLALILTLSLR